MEAEKLEKKLAAREAMLQDTLRQLSVSKFLLQDLQQDQSAAKVGSGGVASAVMHAWKQVPSCSVTCHGGVPCLLQHGGCQWPTKSLLGPADLQQFKFRLQRVLCAAFTHDLLELDPGQTSCPAGEQVGG